MDDRNPHAGVELRQYPDSPLRVSYTPLPRKGGNPNAVASEVIAASIVARLPNAASVLAQIPVAPVNQVALPDDPELEPLKVAGWL